MSTVTRDEFETVRNLLLSAGQKLDQVSTQQVTTQAQLDQLSTKVDALAAAQSRTQAQLDLMAVRVTQVSERLDSFVSVAQLYFSRHSESIEQLKGISERLEGILSYLVRKQGE